MSTKFTEMDEDISTAKPLGLALHNAHQWVSASLLQLMHDRGYEELTSSHLSFFCGLDCGLTHASAVGRRLGITRQAVYKTTKELQRLGILELLEGQDDKRQKVISMTTRGEEVALSARECMGIIEAHLGEILGTAELRTLISSLQIEWGETLSTNG